jgi:hypothetical protein
MAQLAGEGRGRQRGYAVSSLWTIFKPDFLAENRHINAIARAHDDSMRHCNAGNQTKKSSQSSSKKRNPPP